MRNALNSNPKVQLGVVAVLLVLGVFLMMSMKSKKPTPGAPATQSSATGSATAGGTSAPVAAGGTAAPAGSAAPAASAGMPSVSSGTVTPEALIPGPGLPKPVIKAWKGGDAIVLLIRGHGIDDELVNQSVSQLNSEGGISVFVAPASDVARYSRITQGVGIDRTPALIVVRPRKVSGPTPDAQVSYAFRNAESVVQAVHDALYAGPDDLPYSPG